MSTAKGDESSISNSDDFVQLPGDPKTPKSQWTPEQRMAHIQNMAQIRGYTNPDQSKAFYGDMDSRLAALSGRAAPTMTGAKLGASPEANATAAMLGKTTIDKTQEDQYREGQMGLMKQLQLQSQGGGPSLAGAQLKQGNEQNVGNTMAMLASTRGSVNPALAMRGAAGSFAQGGQVLNQQMANARMQEQLNAQGALAGVTGTGRAQDQATALAQAQLDQQMGLANQGATNNFSLSQALANMQMKGQYGLAQGQFDQGAASNNLNAYLQNQGMGDAQSRFLMAQKFAKQEADRAASIGYDQSREQAKFHLQQRDDALNARTNANNAAYASAAGSAIPVAGGAIAGAGSSANATPPSTGPSDQDKVGGYLSDEKAKKDIQPGKDAAYDFLAKMSAELHPTDEHGNSLTGMRKNREARELGGKVDFDPPENVQYFHAHKPGSWEAYRAAKFAEANPNFREEALAPYRDTEHGPLGGEVSIHPNDFVKESPAMRGFEYPDPKYSDAHKAELYGMQHGPLGGQVSPGKGPVSGFEEPPAPPTALEEATGTKWQDSQTLSDARAKTGPNVEDFYKRLGDHEYSYKNPAAPGAAPGVFVSPMAQEIEKAGPIGKSMVHTGPDGMKMVDYPRVQGLEMSALASVIKDIEMLKKRIGGSHG